MSAEPLPEQSRPAGADDETIAELLRQIAERDRRIAALKEQIVELNAVLIRRERIIGDQELLISGDEPNTPIRMILERLEYACTQLEAIIERMERIPDREDELAEARLFITQVRSSTVWKLANLYWRPAGWLRRAFGR